VCLQTGRGGGGGEVSEPALLPDLLVPGWAWLLPPRPPPGRQGHPPQVARGRATNQFRRTFQREAKSKGYRDGILGHQLDQKDSILLLHAIHSPFYWRILKNTIRYSVFKRKVHS
jgi:hypothetical protein